MARGHQFSDRSADVEIPTNMAPSSMRVMLIVFTHYFENCSDEWLGVFLEPDADVLPDQTLRACEQPCLPMLVPLLLLLPVLLGDGPSVAVLPLAAVRVLG